MIEFRQVENFNNFEVGRMYYWREIRTGKLGMFTHYEGHKTFDRFEWGPMVPTAEELNQMMNNMCDALEHLETMCGCADDLAKALRGSETFRIGPNTDSLQALFVYETKKKEIENDV